VAAQRQRRLCGGTLATSLDACHLPIEPRAVSLH
jgi:hypothetical protein